MSRVKDISNLYYSRKDVQESILKFCKDRETIARYTDSFGKRPDTLQYSTDIIQQVRNGATSFHCSQELWTSPLEISTDMSKDDANLLRKGWDLLIDIDSKYLDYSKITAELLLEALEFHGIKNYSAKFSGSKGFHIIVPWKAFPQTMNNLKTSDMFPEWPRIITNYLQELIKSKLQERIAKLEHQTNFKILDEDAGKHVMPDLILVSPRHLFRAPYSLHEKTALASIVLSKEELKNFQPKLADPLKVVIKDFYPQANEQEARELLVQALDWAKIKVNVKEKKEYQEISVDKSTLVYPPSINKILEGLEDGKKRALFILLNFYKSLNFTREEVEQKIEDWNAKNKKQLKEGYIRAQIDWTFNHKTMLPPNYDKPYYKDIGITPSDEEIRFKNPVNFAKLKSRK